ncbi:flagellar hook protein FlgE [Klenkia soli]|uniref:Flagellar hook protein FlgE n=1 Tax=Klenkia soli TaxID=1052260 RepID=A0A1H0CMF3_9ACTN|nr:flagellar hook protein FlgE [Klenkia soli]SDN59059.1 flagellar hook protein FlgE [Klenkia soli]
MLRSMFSAISGLRAHQTKMDTVANNIANVNTVGYKSTNTVFETTLTQVLRDGKSPDSITGGANPAQIGLGVKLAAITTNFGQGKTQNTDRALDFMIQGDGFFVTKDGNQQLYTRAGSFSFDGTGNLTTADGAVLQGWMADAQGQVNTGGPLRDLQVAYGATKQPKATDGTTIAGNLASGTATGGTKSFQQDMYDAQGTKHTVTFTYTKVAAAAAAPPAPAVPDNAWDMAMSEGATNYGTQRVVFGADGKVSTVGGAAATSATFNPTWVGADPVVADLSNLSQFATGAEVNATVQTGYASGSLNSFALANDGTIIGVYSNGQRQAIGQLALATFNNPSGLVNMGNTSYAIGDNSGNALIGTAGTGSLGSLSSGALEMSNVDLSEEFTGLIIAQRGFQANSRVISASDELLQDLVNLKR